MVEVLILQGHQQHTQKEEMEVRGMAVEMPQTQQQI